MKRICITLSEKSEAQLAEIQNEMDISRAYAIRYVINEFCMKKNVKVEVEAKPKKEKKDPRLVKDMADIENGTFKDFCPACQMGYYPKCGCTIEEVEKELTRYYKYN